MWETLCGNNTPVVKINFFTYESLVLCIFIVSIPLIQHIDDFRSNLTASDNMMTAPTDTNWGPSKISKAAET